MRGIWNWAIGNNSDKKQQEVFLSDLNEILGVKNPIVTKQTEQYTEYILLAYEADGLKKYPNIKAKLIDLLPQDLLPKLCKPAVLKKDIKLIDKLLDADKFSTPFDDKFASLTLDLRNDKNKLLDKLIKKQKVALNDRIAGGVVTAEQYIFEDAGLDGEFLELILSNPTFKLDDTKRRAIVEFIGQPDVELSDKLASIKSDLIDYIVKNGQWDEFSTLHNKNFILKDDMAKHANVIYQAILDKKVNEDLINDISDQVKIQKQGYVDSALNMMREGEALKLIKTALDDKNKAAVEVLFAQLRANEDKLDEIVVRPVHKGGFSNKTVLGEIVDHLASSDILPRLLELPIKADKHISRIANYFLEHKDAKELIDILDASQTNSAKAIKARFIKHLFKEGQDDVLESFYNQGLFHSDIEIELRDRGNEIALDLYQGGQTSLLNYKLNHLQEPAQFLDIKLSDKANLLELACFNGHEALVGKLILHATDNHKKSALTYLAISNNPKNSIKILDALKIEEALTKREITELFMLGYENGNHQFAEKIASMDGVKAFKKELISLTLVKAIIDGNVECVKTLLDNNPEFTVGTVVTITKSKDGSETQESVEPLFLAAAATKNSNELLEVLLERAKSKNELNVVNGDGHNMLQVAIIKYSPKLANKILQNNDKKLIKALINHPTQDQGTAFNQAFYQITQLQKKIAELAAENDPGVQAKIAERQAQIDGFYQFLNNVLANPDFEINESLKVDLLQPGERKGFKANVLTDTYDSIINILEENPNATPDTPELMPLLELLKKMLERKDLDVNIPNEHQQSILMLAAKAGDSELSVEILSHSDVNVNAVDKYGSTALFYAAQSGNETVARVLAEKKGNMSHINNEGTNILMAAANGGNPEVVKYVLENSNISINARDNNRNNALHYAINSNKVRTVELFARGEWREGIEKQSGATRQNLIETLIGQGVDINAQNRDGRTPLIDAVLKGDNTTVQMLIEHGADINKADKYGNTALIYACFSNNPALIDTLTYEKKLDINHRNNDGLSAYSIAAARGSIENLGKDQKSLDKLTEDDKITIARLRTKMGTVVGSNKETVRLLIDRGADPYDTEPEAALWKKLLVTGAIATSLSAANSLLLATNPLAKEAGQTVIAATTGYAVYTQVSSSVETALRGWMKDGTEWDVKMSNPFMIGSYHIDRWGRVSYGQSLKTTLLELARIKKDSPIIFGVEKGENQTLQEAQTNFKTKLQALNPVAQIELHENLQFKYTRIKYKLDNQYLLPWTRIQLGNVLKEIELADQALMRGKQMNNRDLSNKTTFETQYADVINFLGSDRSREVIIRGLLKKPNDESLNRISKLVDNVLESKIYVSPATYYKCLQFREQQTQIAKNYNSNPGIFTRIYLYITGRGFYNDTKVPIVTMLSNFVAQTDAIKGEATKVTHIVSQEPPSKTYKEVAISALAKLAGQDANEFIANSAAVVGQATGAVAGIGTAIGMDQKSATVAQGAVGVAGAILPTLLPFALPAVAIGGAAYLAYQNSDAITQKANSWYNWLFPVQEVKKITLRQEMDNLANAIQYDDHALLQAASKQHPITRNKDTDAVIVNDMEEITADALDDINRNKKFEKQKISIEV